MFPCCESAASPCEGGAGLLDSLLDGLCRGWRGIKHRSIPTDNTSAVHTSINVPEPPVDERLGLGLTVRHLLNTSSQTLC